MWGAKPPNRWPPGVHLTAGEEAEAGEDGQHVGQAQQPTQHALGLQQQRRAQPKRGEIGKVIQLGTCGDNKGQVPGGHQARGRPAGHPWAGGTHSPSAEQASSCRATAPSARSSRKPRSSSQQEYWYCLGGGTPLLSPFPSVSPHFSLVYPIC